jgi:peptide/nickel transport system permease protein
VSNESKRTELKGVALHSNRQDPDSKGTLNPKSISVSTTKKSWSLSLKVSTAIVVLIFLCGMINPFIYYDPISDAQLSIRYQEPSSLFWLGTDQQGRSVAFRIFKSISAFFFPGLLAGLIAVSIGSALGALCGYLGGRIKRSIALCLELIDTIPRMVFLVLVCTIYTPSISLIAAVSSILFIPTVATVIRRKVEALAAEDYILAHIAHGFHPFKIITYHILWLQCKAILIRQLIFVFSYVLFIETALSYLGDYGVPEPYPSWGNMVASVRDFPPTVWPWMCPAIAIIVSIAALLTFGDQLAQRDEEVKR